MCGSIGGEGVELRVWANQAVPGLLQAEGTGSARDHFQRADDHQLRDRGSGPAEALGGHDRFGRHTDELAWF
jgi:hypothetical protein